MSSQTGRFRRVPLLAGLLALGVLTFCTTRVDPDTARFSCDTTADCGKGFECRPQAALGSRGLCYKLGECSDELCDGLDNDCNGLIDDGFDFTADPAHCGSCEVACGTGSACLDSACVETVCDDGVDNDQNGAMDCLDSACLGRACASTAPELNCGHFPPDAANPDGGAPGCVSRETLCADSMDNDGDGEVDCGDTDCEGKPCDGTGGLCSAGSCLH